MMINPALMNTGGEKVPFFLSAVILGAMILFNRHIQWWIKGSAIIYYAMLTYFFNDGREKIEEQYKNDPIEMLWDKNSQYVGEFVPFFTMPLLVLLLWGYYLWFVHAESRKNRIYIGISIIPASIAYLLLTLFIVMFGYQP